MTIHNVYMNNVITSSVNLLQDSSSLILSNLLKTKATDSFIDTVFSAYPSHAPMNLKPIKRELDPF